jgi:hypothetical protein
MFGIVADVWKPRSDVSVEDPSFDAEHSEDIDEVNGWQKEVDELLPGQAKVLDDRGNEEDLTSF